jgi:heat shock protein HslJ
MPIVRKSVLLGLAFLCFCFQAAPQGQSKIVTGKLIRAVAIGGESTGWAIQLDSEVNIEGKQLTLIEVESRDVKTLVKLENKHVEATGTVSRRRGIERGDRFILSVSSIGELSAKSAQGSRPGQTTEAFNLTGSEWLLTDLGGSGVIDKVQATLALPDSRKVAGHGSCNRFFGPAEIRGEVLKLGPFGATRMACPEVVMNQETKYLKALQAAERFEWKDPYLLLHCKGFEKPLRFTRKGATTPAAPGTP